MWRNYANLPKAVYLLCGGMFVNRAGTLLVPFLALYLRESLGLSAAMATNAIGAYGFGALFASVAGGHLADRYGRRAVMLLALLGGSVVVLAFSTLTRPAAILAAAWLFAFLADMYRPAAAAMLTDLVEPVRRPHAFGLMYVSINLGFAVGPLMGAWLITFTFKWIFWGDAITSTAYAVLILVAIRETLPARPPARAHGHSAPGEPGCGDGDPAQDISLADAARHIARDRVFLIFCLATLLTAAVFLQFISTLPLDMTEHGHSAKAYSRVIAVNGVMIVPAAASDDLGRDALSPRRNDDTECRHPRNGLWPHGGGDRVLALRRLHCHRHIGGADPRAADAGHRR